MAVLCLCAAFGAGCATRQAPRVLEFYPPPPDEPRIQYLTTLTSSADVEKPPNPFLVFLTGYRGQLRGLEKPYGITVSGSRILVCDTALGCLCAFDVKNRAFSFISPRGAGAIGKPINAVADTNGNLYVADVARRRIAAYDSNERYRYAITGGEQFRPVAVAVRNGKVYAADTSGRKIHVHDAATGEALFSVPAATGTGADGDPNLYLPTNLDVDSDGNIYVVDAAAFRVQVYDNAGHYVKSIGSHGNGFGEFARPKGVAIDRAGRMYVVDAAAEVVQVFDAKTGALLTHFGEPGGSEVPLSLPAGIAIDYENAECFKQYVADGFEVEYLILVSNQYDPPRVNVYGFGHRKK